VGINYCALAGAPLTPTVLDPQTGVLAPCAFPGSSDLELLGFSPWRDADGQSQLIALRKHAATERFERDDRAALFGLTRFRFPGGQVLDEVGLDILPLGPVCWFPDRSERILFASADCGLYTYEFGTEHGSPDSATPPPQPLRWQCVAPGVGEVRFKDPCWPGAAELGGRLLVSASVAESATGPYPGPQLWWLHVDPDHATIVAAGRMIGNAGNGGGSPRAPDEERRPCVGRARDGRLLLAYLARAEGQAGWDLWVAPIALDESTRAPRVVRSARHKLAEGCVALALAFSADGRTIHVSLRDAPTFDSWGTLRSYPVPPEL
jgi:hypothetical protein